MTAHPPGDSDDARLDALPAHWRIRRLKHIARLAYGAALPTHDRVAGPIPVYGSNGITGHHDQANSDGPTIVIGRKGSFGKVRYSPGPVWCIDTAFYLDHRHTDADLRWLAWTLEALALDKGSQDTAVPGLSRDDAHHRRLPLPPPAEQRAIAADLDRRIGDLTTAETNLDTRLAHLATLRTSLIREAITGAHVPGPRHATDADWLDTLPRDWQCVPIKRLTVAATGHTPSKSDPELWHDCDIPWVSLADTEAIDRADLLEDTDTHISRAGLAASSAKVVPQGAVICTRDASIGLAALLARPMAISQHIIAWVCGPALRPRWLLYVLYAMRPELEAIARGTTIGTIGMHTLRRLMIPLPTLAEQDALLARLIPRVDAVTRLEATTHRQRAHLTELRAALVLGVTHGTIPIGG